MADINLDSLKKGVEGLADKAAKAMDDFDADAAFASAKETASDLAGKAGAAWDEFDAKAKLEAQYKAEFDELTAKVTEINLQVSEYKQAVELNKYKKALAEVEARIAQGDSSVNTIMAATYGMIALVLLSIVVIVFIVNSINDPMSLVKLLIGLVVIGVIVGGAYMLAPGTALVEYHGDVPPTAGDLKLTDTVLYLAYLAFGATIVALVASWVAGAIRK